MTKPEYLESEKWLRALFSAKAVGRGGVVYRAVRDVERNAGRDALISEVRKRGFTLVQNGEQFVIFCNRDAVRLIADRDRPRLSDRAFPTFRRSSVANANFSTRG
jgi:hypothetical protein